MNKTMRKIPRDARFRCLNCDSRQGRVHRRYKVWLVDLRERLRQQAIIDTWGGLLAIAERKAYKFGWAMHKFRAIYLFWPDALERRLVDPYAELQDWVEREKAKFKAQKKREEKERFEAIKAGQYRDVVEVVSRSPVQRYVSEFMDENDWCTGL